MKNNRDKNGNILRGMAVVMREVSEAGSVKKYKKDIAMKAVSKLFDAYPEALDAVAKAEDRKMRSVKIHRVK